MPKKRAKKVGPAGIGTVPPSDSVPKMRSASAASS